MTLQTCAGLLLTMISMRLLPAGAAPIGWQWVSEGLRGVPAGHLVASDQS